MANWRDKYDEDIIRRVENRDYAGGGADAALMNDEDYARVLRNSQLWQTADEAGRAALHDDSERIRSAYDYSGGVAGNEYIRKGQAQTGTDTQPIKNSVAYWQNQIYDYGKFTDPYQPGIDQKYNAILNRQPFSYDLESDPQWAAYQKQYTRAGQRAYDNALAQLSARTGGLASSYAGGVAQQQYGNYMQQMTDKIPELYKLAYDMYSQDAARDISDLQAIRGLSSDAYGRWSDAYGRLGTAYNVALAQREYDEAKDAAKLYAYGDGAPYEIGSGKGRYFVTNAQPGQTMIGGDGSIWTKEADGSVTITNNGHTWTVKAPAATVKGGGGSKSGKNGNMITYGSDRGMAMIRASSDNPTLAQQYLLENGDNMDEWMKFSLLQNAGYDNETAMRIYGLTGSDFGSYLTANQPEEETSGVGNRIDADANPNISNRYGDSWVSVPGMGRVTWQELYGMVEDGRVEEDYDPETNTVTYRRKGG